MKYTVLGSGLSGIAIAKFLNKRKNKVFVSDSKAINPTAKKLLNDLKIPWEEKGHSETRALDSNPVVIVSPGIPLNTPIVLQALSKGLLVKSEIEVLSRFLPKSSITVGITGTNGKSTTTAFLSYILNQTSLFHSIPCGNIGKPLSDAIEESTSFLLNNKNSTSHPKKIVFPIELSSYQLESTSSFKFDVTIFLNIQEDHLSRYGCLEQYFKAKWRLVLMTKKNGLVLLSHAVFEKAKELGLPFPKVHYGIVFENSSLDENHHFIIQCNFNNLWPISAYGKGTEAILSYVNPPNISISKIIINKSKDSYSVAGTDELEKFKGVINNPVLLGEHNILNLVFGALGAYGLRVPLEQCFQAVDAEFSDFKGLPHRMENVSPPNSPYLIINDSKATNLNSTLQAVKYFNKHVHLLIGGDGKNENFSLLLQYIENPIIKIYPFGKEGPRIYNHLIEREQCVTKPFFSMLEAAEAAKKSLKQNEILLLSPACASFDEFKNFEHRGDTFRMWVNNQKWD